MTGWGFWVVATCLAAGVAGVLMAALRRPGDMPEAKRAAPDADLVVYKDQLAEIARDLTRGTLAEGEATRLRTEIGKRILEADRAKASVDPDTAEPGRRNKLAATVILLLVPATFLVYAGSASVLRGIGLQEDRIATLRDEFSFEMRVRGVDFPGMSLVFEGLGAPGYPDMALGSRLAALDAGIAARPSQEMELAKLGRSRDPALDAALATELAAVSDPEALRARFRTHFEAGELQAAVRSLERLLAVPGDRADADDHANLALALVAEAGGYVSPEAEASLRETLTRDMGNEMARYLVGEMFLQGGRYDQAFRFWRPIAEGGSGTPWVPYIRAEIEAVAGLAGITYALPETTPGPSAEDVTAAGEMAPQDRQTMIEGMVAQLSDRLATDGGTVEDWNRLIRSLVVLERKPDAQVIYDEAKVTFAGMDAELSFLRLAAVETGLTP